MGNEINIQKRISYVANRATGLDTSSSIHDVASTVTRDDSVQMSESREFHQQPPVGDCPGQRDRINSHNQRFSVDLLLIRSQIF